MIHTFWSRIAQGTPKKPWGKGPTESELRHQWEPGTLLHCNDTGVHSAGRVLELDIKTYPELNGHIKRTCRVVYESGLPLELLRGTGLIEEGYLNELISQTS